MHVAARWTDGFAVRTFVEWIYLSELYAVVSTLGIMKYELRHYYSCGDMKSIWIKLDNENVSMFRCFTSSGIYLNKL